MAEVQHGALLLADITGYSEYLGGVELEHCHDVLAKLLSTLTEQVRGVMEVSKLEGDAVFCYDSQDGNDAEVLVATVEACYFAFANLRRHVEVNLTCACDACRRVPELDLKLIGHHGSFVEEQIAGSRELIGSDVVLAHRLLKNSVTERTGLRGYALLTGPCVEHFGLETSGLIECRQNAGEAGDVECWVFDLGARWREEQERTAVVVTEEESVWTITGEVPVPPAVVWEWLTSPTKKILWRHADKRIETPNRQATRGVGTVTHCIMKPPYGSYAEEFVDWKPYRYFTSSSRGRFGEFVYTTELEPIPNGSGTRLTTRVRPGNWRQRMTMRLFGRQQRALWEEGSSRLERLLREAATTTSPPET